MGEFNYDFGVVGVVWLCVGVVDVFVVGVDVYFCVVGFVVVCCGCGKFDDVGCYYCWFGVGWCVVRVWVLGNVVDVLGCYVFC